MSGCKQMSILSCITELDESSPRKCTDQAATILVSPISGIVHELMNTTLSQHNCSKRKNNVINENLNSNQHGHSNHGYHEGLFKNAFKIKNTDDMVKSKPKARRLLGMGSRRFSSPEPISPSFDKENNSVACISHTSSASPQKIVGVKRPRHPLEDWDPNSQDSGYEASFLEKEEKSKRDRFRFVEPLAVAPRRMFECRSPMESPIRSSPQRTRVARPSLFRSLSSGYESMDDGFNELIDENSDGTTELPNGISTLICGDIVSCDVENETMISDSNPSTPEFPRTSNGASGFRRSLLLQDERQEDRRNSSLSKVRSCLFRSPNASSSTVNPGFEDTSPLASTIPVTRRRRISSDFVDRNAIANCGVENNSPLFVRTFKRPDPPINDSPKLIKKSRMSNSFNDIAKECDVNEGMAFDVKYVQRNFSSSESVMPTAIETTNIEVDVEMESETETEVKSEDETHAHIKSAIHRSITDADLTGDFSKPCVLPLAVGHHEDLKSISVDTLAALIHGEFSDRIGSFKIVDCRYPYEFDAGHIQGALNLYSKDLIEQILLDPLTNRPEIQPDTNKRSILVFHCEFSWERGPNLSRFLRSLDRQRNKEHYPALYYPEVYLLHGGYEKFYKEQKALCTPQGYRPMRHPDNQADLRQFRNKSKSWQGEKSRIGGSATRNNLKRLGF